MILDSSALVAVMFREPDHEDILDKLEAVPSVAVGTPTLVETGIVLAARTGRDCRDPLRRVLDELEVIEVPFGERHWREALRAWWLYGRGRHRANLNLGDCFSYAVASLADEPLLFVGDDFRLTDIKVA
ncbi:MAG: type II toxin-antitoxin system VapC family toxin [Acidimicrobiales bacterium]